MSSAPASRRHYLCQAVMHLATPHRLPAAAGQEPLRLGFSLYGMKTLPLADSIAACARLGYRDVEFALTAGFPNSPRRCRSDPPCAA